MKITVVETPLHAVRAQALVVLADEGVLLGRAEAAGLARHLDSFQRAVEKKTSKREWFCTLEKDAGCATEHLLLESTSFGGAHLPAAEALKMAAHRAVDLCREYSLHRLAVAAQREEGAPALASALLEGIALGDYFDQRYKSKPSERAELELTFVVLPAQAKLVRAALERTLRIAEATNHAREMVNTPHHDLTPAALAEEAVTLAKRLKLGVDVLDEKKLKKQGYLPTLEVGRGSEYPPRMVVLRHRPKKPRAGLPHLGLVGKGVTFDTGGLCLKPRDSMHWMNADMGGAAAVLGATRALVELGYGGPITTIIAAAHNAIDGAAFHPGAVIRARNGRTIYIENTDAEGRLLLSDCFHRAGEEKVEVMINLATLTGSVSQFLGTAMAGLFTEDEELAALLAGAGQSTGDALWRLPLVREYESSLKHPLADVSNIAGDGKAGGIQAANFLRMFVPEGVRWAHLDIAGVARAEKPRRYFRAGGTGYGVRLLVEAATRLAAAPE